MNGYTMPEYPAMNVMILKKFTGTRVYGGGERERDSQCGAELALEDDGEKNENPPEVNISIICESFVISAPFLPHSSLQ